MIYDTLDRIGEYRGMGEWLDRAIDFLENTDMERLPSGRTEIAGTDCFINVMETVTKEETQADFEVHRKYMDIQIDLEGMEEIQIGGTTEGEKFPYSEEMYFGTVLCEKKAARFSCRHTRFMRFSRHAQDKPAPAQETGRFLFTQYGAKIHFF